MPPFQIELLDSSVTLYKLKDKKAFDYLCCIGFFNTCNTKREKLVKDNYVKDEWLFSISTFIPTCSLSRAWANQELSLPPSLLCFMKKARLLSQQALVTLNY